MWPGLKYGNLDQNGSGDSDGDSFTNDQENELGAGSYHHRPSRGRRYLFHRFSTDLQQGGDLVNYSFKSEPARLFRSGKWSLPFR